jgi:GT2 family glycosyltransferase
MTLKLTSVVIVNWNGREFLLQCIESLLTTASEHFLEIIVVDNGSTDGSPAAVRERFASVVVFETGQNLGFARGMNLGVRQSKGEYLLFVNSDTMAHPESVQALVRFMESHPRVGMVSPRVVGKDGRSQHVVGHCLTLWRCFQAVFGSYDRSCPCCHDSWQQERQSTMPQTVELIMLCFTLVRRKAMEQVGLLDENFFMYGEDVDFSKRFRDDNWELVFLPSASIFHYGGGSSERMPVKFYIELLRSRIQYFRKHNGCLGAWICRAILILHMIVRLLFYSMLSAIRSGPNNPSFDPKKDQSLAALRALLTGSC